MSYGKMNSFCEIIAKTKDKDSEGFVTDTETTLASVRCYHEARHGSIKWSNLASFSDVTDLFQLRTIPNVKITTDHFIKCDDEIFNIISVDNVKGKNMYLEILAKKVVPTYG